MGQAFFFRDLRQGRKVMAVPLTLSHVVCENLAPAAPLLVLKVQVLSDGTLDTDCTLHLPRASILVSGARLKAWCT